ncbi:SDR family oxidoreductase [Luteipulveratus halotolerans]|uniref:NmrA-like domain-containing protein n=1 Tax=Luteipulveratus halotolerans TaxID=1631356 RepID=A0A0L6CDU0_9MICO|nr:NmrA family NAD(P)-binding protein [Luteipulveratus halotolerans]KNX35854.1 hypothetical protein VV01_21450 [Luteipulveratus halotolerans]
MRILMTGATGRNAGHVLPELLARGATVRALTRNRDRAALAREAGAQESSIGDLRDPASLRRAMHGVDAVFHLNPAFAPDEAGLGVNMVRAARASGVTKFVFSGAYHPSLSLTNHSAKRAVEEALYASGLTFTVLQPAMFMQNLAGLRDAASSGVIAFPYATTAPLTYVDLRDVAEVVAIAATESSLDNGTFELAASPMTDTNTIAGLLATQLGTPVRAERVDPDTWLARAAVPQGPLLEGLGRMNVHYDTHGFRGGNDLVLRTILSRPPRSLGEYIRELTRA